MYKKVYDENKGTFIYVDPWTGQEAEGSEGSGIFDALSSVGQKIFSSSIKEASKKALETVGKQALESGAKKIGSEVGNLAVRALPEVRNKVANVIKGRSKTLSENKKPTGEMIIKELRGQVRDPEDINMRINKMLSGSGRANIKLRAKPPRPNIQMRVNKLLLK